MERLAASQIALPGLDVSVLESCDSTNSRLLEAPASVRPVLLAAERQSAGRGRRGRRWHALPGGSIAFSVARTIRRPIRELPGLSLIAGAAAARALRALGARGVSIKWPNDLMVGDAKLGGILVETRMSGGAPLAVIGIGINHARDPLLARRLRRRVACLEDVLRPLPPRNAVIREIAARLLAALEKFERGGLPAAQPRAA